MPASNGFLRISASRRCCIFHFESSSIAAGASECRLRGSISVLHGFPTAHELTRQCQISLPGFVIVVS
jgi:hypothetical protein